MLLINNIEKFNKYYNYSNTIIDNNEYNYIFKELKLKSNTEILYNIIINTLNYIGNRDI